MDRGGRHYGLDWLRIAAFALLIVYHVAMVFSPWHWVIKAPVPDAWLIAPMAVLTPWRLPLLFAVSGYASRRLFEKSGDIAAFVRSRNARLLVPLAFAAVALLPPELWVRARLAGYPGTLWRFWAVDYWRPSLPTDWRGWEHLWFVVYLWAYTMVIAGVLALGGSGCAGALAARVRPARARPAAAVGAGAGAGAAQARDAVRRVRGRGTVCRLDRACRILADAGVRLRARRRHRIVAGDPSRLAACARDDARIGRDVVTMELIYRADIEPPHAMMALDRTARLVMAWSMIVVLLHLAEATGTATAAGARRWPRRCSRSTSSIIRR